MTTQPLTTEREQPLSVPIGSGKREIVDLPTEGIDSALLVANKRSAVGAASYQSIADQLLSADFWSPRRIFVTSPTAGDGKTCTAFNLAWTLSKRGKSVLLIELNFARPRFSNALGGLQLQFGIDCAIRSLSKPAETVFSIGNELLNVSAVKNAMRKSELKHHLPQLGAFIKWGSNNFDWLILDCPPVLSLAWDEWFHVCARPALLVVRDHHTPAVQVRQATSRLGAALKGVLLNDVANAGNSEQIATGD